MCYQKRPGSRALSLRGKYASSLFLVGANSSCPELIKSDRKSDGGGAEKILKGNFSKQKKETIELKGIVHPELKFHSFITHLCLYVDGGSGGIFL